MTRVFEFTLSGSPAESRTGRNTVGAQTSALLKNSPSQNVNNKSFKIFFNFEWPKQPCHYKKQWEFRLNMTSEQGHIGQIQFYLGEWYL